VSATPTNAGSPGIADMAPAATIAAVPPFRNTRLLNSLMETSWAGSGLLGDGMPFTWICSWFVTAGRVDDGIEKKFPATH
jgi:hypothetical protein